MGCHQSETRTRSATGILSCRRLGVATVGMLTAATLGVLSMVPLFGFRHFAVGAVGRVQTAPPQQPAELPKELLFEVEQHEKSITEALESLDVERMKAAIPLAERVLSVRGRHQGDAWWRTVDARNSLADLRFFSALSADDRRALMEAWKSGNEGAKLHEAGKYPEASERVRQMADVERRILGEHHLYYAESLVRLASVNESLKRFADAETLRRQVLQIRERALGQWHPAYAQSLISIASLLHWSMNRSADAEAFYYRALEIRRTTLGETHPDSIRTLDTLAYLYRSTSRYADAERLYLQLMAIRKRTVGEMHPEYATALHDLAFLYWMMNRFGDAEPLYRRAVEIRKQVLGASHADYVHSVLALAALYQSWKRYADAEPLYREAVNIRKAVLGEAHPEYIDVLDRLAWVYRSMKRDAEAEALYRSVLEARARQGETHPDHVKALNNLAFLYWSTQRYAEAEPLYLKALEIRRRTVGASHPDYATSLENLALLDTSLDRFAQAEARYREALEIRRKAQGEGSRDFVSTARSLARIYSLITRFAEAEPIFQQILEHRRKLVGEAHPDLGQSLDDLASLYSSMGRHLDAEPYARQALAIRKTTPGETSSDYVTSVNRLAFIYQSTNRFSEAEPLYREVLEIRRKVVGEAHPDYAASLGSLASLHQSMARFTEAEAFYKRALEITKAAGDTAREYAGYLTTLAGLYAAMGRLPECETLLRQALEIRGQTLGTNHLTYALSLATLAGAQQSMGRFSEAEPLYRQALAIRKKQVGETDQVYATWLNALAVLYSSVGRFTEAEPLHRQALEITLKASGDAHPVYARNLSWLAAHYFVRRRFAEAEPLFRQALELDQRLGRDTRTDFASDLAYLASLYAQTDRPAEAEPLYTRALEILSKSTGPSSTFFAVAATGLADLYLKTGRYELAEARYRESLAVLKSALGDQHPSYALATHNLGHVLALTGRSDAAASVLLDSAVSQWQHLTGNFPAWSAEQKRQFQSSTGFGQSDVISSLVFSGRGPAQHGLQGTLLIKQLTFEAARQESGALRAAVAAAPSEWQALWREREQLRKQFGMLALQSLSELGRTPGAESPGMDPKYVRALADQIEQVDQRLRQSNPAYAAAARLRRVTLADATRALGPRQALVEYVRYRPYDFAARLPGRVRYGAFVLRGGPAAVVAIDLGEGDAIDRAVHEFRAAVRSAIDEYRIIAPSPGKVRRSEATIAQASSVVHARVWQPLKAALADVERAYVAPDGALSLIPFEALAREEGRGWRYLIEDYQLIYLATGRDLGRMSQTAPRADARTAVLIGNPAFDATAPQTAAIVAGLASGAAGTTQSAVEVSPATLGTVTAGEARRELPRNWSQVPSLEELLARAQKQLIGLGWHVTTLTDRRAVEEAALGVQAPRLLQFATHGYILDKPSNAEAGWDNPLLRSMLLLAGANTWTRESSVFYRVAGKMLREKEARTAGLSEAELQSTRLELADGVLTAYEVTGMNLHGTELVNLTACETGLGEVTADGVVGLRQAFLLAGARAMTMSMWEVPASETTTQMGDFYERWLSGGKVRSKTTRYGAFRSAQLNALARARETHGGGHPFYWAGTVYVGDPGDLPDVSR